MSVKACPVCASTRSVYERTLNRFELYKCERCEFIFANISGEAISKANFYHEDRPRSSRRWKKSAIDLVWFMQIANRFSRSMPPGRVLDVGCGQGVLLHYFKRHGWTTFGVDPSPWARSYAELYDFTLFQDTLESADLAPGFFDLVLSTSTLEHIENPVDHVKKIVSILKPDGKAFFAGIPNYEKITKSLKSTYLSNSPPGHVNFFSKRSMRYLFSLPEIDGDLRNVKVHTYGVVGAPLIYQSALKLKKKEPQPSLTMPGQEEGSPSEAEPLHKVSEIPWLANLLGRIVVAVNYYIGRIGMLGDKLQVEIQKSSKSAS